MIGESDRAHDRRVEHVETMRELRPHVLRRDNYTCQAGPYAPGDCEGTLRAHHRKPRGRGGPDTLANLVTVCGGTTGSAGHHGWIHEGDPTEATRLGLLISAYDPDPTDRWRHPDTEHGLAELPVLDWWAET